MSITTPDPTLEFVGVFADQTEDVILARMEGWANEGLDPVADAGQWVDTREGGHWQTATMPGVREIARLYDLAGTEVPMCAFVLWAWGTYLDDLAAVYDVERNPAVAATGFVTFTGPAGSIITVGDTVATVPISADDTVPEFGVTTQVTIPNLGSGLGAVDAPVTATVPGLAGDVAAGAIVAPSTPLPAGVTVSNAAATLGGADPESDDALRIRVLAAIEGHGPGTAADYVTWASAFSAAIGNVKVVPAYAGANTVLVTIADVNDQPLPSGTVTGLQDNLDPVSGKGQGVAPIGAQVTVETNTILDLVVAATVTYQTGYSATGAGSTVALAPQISAAITAYLNTILPGDAIVLSHIAGIIATTPGVHDVTGVELNSGTTNITLTLTPPQSPVLTTLTI